MGVVRYRVAAAVLFTVSAGASAQVPPEMAAQIRAAEPMDPTVGRLYAPLFGPEAWQGVTSERDLAYGDDPLRKLDVFSPESGAKDLPVLLFVHGGGFTRGDKHGAFYPDNAPLWAARNGMIGVTINYRLALDAPWPAAAEDLAAAIAWTHANIARYGGDPDRIVLFGHSAGANHVADYVGNPQVRGAELAAVKGAMLLSPNYPTEAQAGPPHAYYGADHDLNSTIGSIARLRASRVPLFLADAEFDPQPMLATASALREGLCRTAARCPKSVHLKDHNHFTEGMALGTADQSLGGPLLEWIEALPD